MLALFVNDKSLDLSNDISITLKFSSPVFNSIGDYTYPFKLPATPLNVSVLGFKHRIENSLDPFQVFDANLQWNGVILLKGTLRILNAQSDLYEATLFMDKGDFVYRRKYMTLQDVDFGSLSWNSEAERLDYFNSIRNQYYPQKPFCFPMIKNMTYFEELPENPMLYYLNYYHWNNLQILFEGIDRAVFVPMLYLKYVLDFVFKKLDYALDDSFFAPDPEFDSLTLYNHVDANSTLAGLFNYDSTKLFMNYHAPRMTMNDFLTGLENFFNIRFFVNNITRIVKLVSVDQIVKSSEAIPFSNNVSLIYTQIGDPIKGYHLKMNMETDDEFWTAMQPSQAIILDNIKEAVEAYKDLPIWPASPNGEIRYVRSEGVYYILWDRAWTIIYLNEATYSLHSEFIHHESDKSIETKFSTLMNNSVAPYDCAVGSAQSGWQETAPKLFFAKFHPRTGGGIDDERMYASNFSTSHSLFYYGANGLYVKHFKTFFEYMMAAKQVKFVKQMSLLELNQLDFSKKVEINGNKYLLSEVQVAITHKGIKPATIIAYTSL
ncbi:MAG: hypothetical protein NT040_11260 [Bacteroidetes bacterium]|nr:hypothetical protein [Bacteroidota bacterium]